jgi:hypothetical protein
MAHGRVVCGQQEAGSHTCRQLKVRAILLLVGCDGQQCFLKALR